ncbi:MAG: outer membrane protein assembly factor BamD [Rikenellaceae bacterium]
MAKFFKFLFCSALFVCFVSCTGFDKLLKSRDYQTMYETGLEYFANGKNNKAMFLFSQIEPIFNGTSKADTIKFYLAKTYYEQSYYDESARLFDEFRKNYGRSGFVEEAEYLYAMSYYQEAASFELDQTPTELAIIAFSEYASRYPDSERVESVDDILDELQMRLYDKAFEIGKIYYDIGYYNSAITAFKNVVKKYPDIPHREEILYLIAKANYLFARNSIDTKQRERYYNTIDATYNFQAEYPDSKHSTEINRILLNATKLSEGKQLIQKAGEDSELTEKQIIKGTKRYEKLQKMVDTGKITAEELEEIVEKELETAKEKTRKRRERFGDDDVQISSSIVNPSGGATHQDGAEATLKKAEQISEAVEEGEAKKSKRKNKKAQETESEQE